MLSQRTECEESGGQSVWGGGEQDVTAATRGKFQKSNRRLESQWPHQQEQKSQKNEMRHIPSRDEKSSTAHKLNA